MRPPFRFAIVCALALGLCGCVGTSAPAETGSSAVTESAAAPAEAPSGTLTDADIAAAKQAYLDYAAAVDAMDLSDRSSLDFTLSFTTNGQHEYDSDFYSDLRNRGWRIEGDSKVLLAEVLSSDDNGEVIIAACVDLSEVQFFDETGTERVPPDDVDVVSSSVTVTRDEAGKWLLADIAGRDGEPKCL